MLTAYKFRLYPNKDQKEMFSKYFGCSRVVWNKALELRESYYKEDKTIGIDMGLKDFAVLSNGVKISNPKFLQKSEKLLKSRQRALSRKQKGSKNRDKARLMVAKTHEKVANQRNDFLHKVSTAITKQFDTIVIETLNIKEMKKNHSLAKSISNVSWSRFFEFIKYKAEKQGKNIIEIGMFQKSSKTCSVCGHVNKGLTLKEREWICKSCKTKLDRDINAAINIRNFGLKQIGLNQIPSDRGEYKPVENPMTAELVKMKIKARSTSHDPEKQELYAMKKLKLLIGAGSP